MKKTSIKLLLMVTAALSISACSVTSKSSVTSHTGPQAGERTYAQNYKDMVFAICIANAYEGDTEAAKDAGSSVSALREWALYDLDMAPDAIKELVDSYLNRNYKNPLVESEVSGVRFDFLKCLDMYHSKALAAQVKRLVISPNRTYRQDSSD